MTAAPRYDFDDDFQSKVAALALRDSTFNIRTEGLIEPGYFSNESEAILVNLASKFWLKYKAVPSTTVMARLIKKATDSKIIRSDQLSDVVEDLQGASKGRPVRPRLRD